MTFFCESCGVRTVAPGKCKACDANGVAAFDDKPSAKAGAPKTESAPADDKAASEPRKG